MYRMISDFNKDWQYESEMTLKIFSKLTDNSLDQKVNDNGRDLGFIAWHIVTTLSEMMNRTGLTVNGPDENSDRPAKVKEIVAEYKKCSEELLNEVNEKWDDTDLVAKLEMYGQSWQKGDVLSALLRHQTHHRGQITILMRQAGLIVPGAYGPAKEEWESIGMQPMK